MTVPTTPPAATPAPTGTARPAAAPPPAVARSLIGEVLPRYETREVHEVVVEASQADVYRALQELTIRDLPVFRVLMGARALPARLARSGRRPGAHRPRPLDPDVRRLDWGLRGFTVLAQRPGSGLVIGGPGQPWRLAGGTVARIRNLAEFLASDRPRYAKLALGFRLEPVPGGTRVITETRVDTTDPLAHRRFVAYWRIIRGQCRDPEELAARHQRRAERLPAATAPPTR